MTCGAADDDVIDIAGVRVRCRVERALPPLLEVGAGTVQIVTGYCFAPTVRVRALALWVGNERGPIGELGEVREDLAERFAAEDRAGRCLTAGFRALVPVEPARAGETLALALDVTLADGTRRTIPVGSTRVIARPPRAHSDSPVQVGDGPLVAICLASYDPAPAAFARQIDSIMRQTHRNWTCIVCDDASAPERRAEIEAVCRRDPRLRVVTNDERVGFYRNFERALRSVPTGTEFIALADQDDYWYPDKLARCLSAFRSGVTLVYSDMRIVRPDGTVAAASYWTNRRNNHRDLDVVLVANTITGAASVFRAGLLDRILPFPERIGDAFHDHWIGSVALMAGQVGYVDAPLYDYIQHRASVIGHYDFGRISWKQRCGKAVREIKRLLGRHDPGGRATSLGAVLLSSYERDYRRIQLAAATLRLRFPERSREQDDVLNICSGLWRSVAALLRLHLKVWWRGETTEDAELRLAGSYVAHRMHRLYVRLFAAREIRRFWKVPA